LLSVLKSRIPFVFFTYSTNYEDFEHSADVSSHHADLVARNQQLEEQVFFGREM